MSFDDTYSIVYTNMSIRILSEFRRVPMQISSNIQINQQTPGTGRPDQQGGVFQNMRPGQKITVEVVGSESGSLTLKTEDGQLVKADFPGATVMLPGDKLELTMLGKGSNNVHFQLSMVNGQSVQISVSEMEAKMADIGVEPSEMNVKSAEFLAERGVQPTPERIAIMVKVATYFPELPAAAALFMAANNIPVTKNNVSALLEWLQGGDLLGDEAQQLTEAVTQMITGRQDQGAENAQQAHAPLEQNTATSLQQGPQLSPQAAEVMKESFVSHVIRNPEFPASTISLSSLTEFAQGIANMGDGDAQAAIKDFLAGYPSLDGQQRAELTELLTSAYNMAKSTAEAQQQTTQGSIQQPAQGGQESAGQQQAAGDVNQNADKNLNAPAEPNGTVLPGTEQVVDGGGKTPIQEAGQRQAQTTQVVNTTADGNDQAQQSGIRQAADGNHAQQQPMTSDGEPVQPNQGNTPVEEMKQVIQQLQRFVVSMKNDAAADAENLQESVKNQQNIAENIKSTLSHVAGETSNVAQKAADISSRVQLGNNIENFYYCQIPFQVGQDRNTAELYVFERKRKSDEGDRTNTTILIALETQRMGRVETVIKAEQDNLNIEFRVENDPVQKYLQTETDELNKLLSGSNFNVTEISVVRMDVPATPLNVDQVLGEKEEFELKTIDISI